MESWVESSRYIERERVAIPTFPEFIDVASVTREAYNSALPAHEEASDFQWFSLRSWIPSARCSLFGDSFVIDFADYHDSDRRFLSFSGGMNPDEVAHSLLDWSLDAGYGSTLELVPESVALKLSDSFVIHEDHENHDYLYSSSMTSEAVHPRYKRFRRVRSSIERNFGPRVRFVALLPLSNYMTRIVEITEKWASDQGYDVDAVDELEAVGRFLGVVREEGEPDTIRASGLLLDDELVAYSIDEVIRASFAVGHFGHAVRSIPNGSTYLHWKVLDSLNRAGVQWLNDEQDLGQPGLRTHKTMLQPERMVRKFRVSRQTESV
jgi:hypothetical protein